MSIFCFKKLNKNERLYEKFKRLRESENFTLEEISKKTHIPIKYLTAIEECRFYDLPPTTTHRTAYIKKYAEILNIKQNDILKKFNSEDGYADIIKKHPNTKIKELKNDAISSIIKNIFIGIIIFIFISYMGWQIRGVLKPPDLIVYSPPEGFVTASQNILIEGRTNKETKITVNGQEIKVKDDGHFSNYIDLSKGINTINIVASNKHGKSTGVTKNVIVKN